MTLAEKQRVVLPFTSPLIQAKQDGSSLTITALIGLRLSWNRNDRLELQLNKNYANKTCGLCGDFNGVAKYNEFVSEGVTVNVTEFGNQQKLDQPIETCEEPSYSPQGDCGNNVRSKYIFILFFYKGAVIKGEICASQFTL
ncbi:hypothetical protein NDU88_003796 [Pleurodeles waltl]|uniref:VWFD domain-containing protein n=1 Tax=Pleurodeles waltl TaxID=8319 RepID=A0AAV7TQL0_PLEWA|nr:hypothetical protein NDU88_003796 [Pleurodeles waltl]